MSERRRSSERDSDFGAEQRDWPNRPKDAPGGKRAAARTDQVGFHFLIELDHEALPIEAWSTNLLDLSAAGCGLMQVESVALGVRYGVVFMRHGRWEAHLGEVVHCRAVNADWHRLGLRFVDDAAACRRFLGYVNRVFGFPTGVSDAA